MSAYPKPVGLKNGGNSAQIDWFFAGGDRFSALAPDGWWRQEVTREDFADGVGMAQVQTITVGAAGIVAGTLGFAFSGKPLPSAVSVSISVAAGDADDAIATAAAVAIEAESALDAVVASSDDGADIVNTYTAGQGGVVCDVTFTPAQVIDLTFGGTATDGDYIVTVSGGGLANPVPAPVVRSTTPATNTDLANAMEAALEGLATAGNPLAGVLVSADNAGAVNTIRFAPGIPAVTLTLTAPSPGTLAQADATPAGNTYTQANAYAVTLNTMNSGNAFPQRVMRSQPMLSVGEAWPVGSTVTLGDALATVALQTSTSLTSAGILSNTVAALQYSDRPEMAFSPLATINVGASGLPATGQLDVAIMFQPLLSY